MAVERAVRKFSARRLNRQLRSAHCVSRGNGRTLRPTGPLQWAFWSPVFTLLLPDFMPDSSSSNWADMAASLLGKLSGGVELSCAFDQMELQVPNPQNPNAPAATWKLNGSLRIRTRGDQPTSAPQLPTSTPNPGA